MTEVRASIFLDQLQPQTLAYISTWMRGTLPRSRMAAQIIEIAPGIDVEVLTDLVVKSADVGVGILAVERQFGTLQFHSYSAAEVHAGSAALLNSFTLGGSAFASPKILASKVVTKLDDQHAFLMNRNRLGSLVVGGDSIYLLECQPAAYAILACNEVEKESHMKVIDVRMIGASGRLYLAGTEAEMRNAKHISESALEAGGKTL